MDKLETVARAICEAQGMRWAIVKNNGNHVPILRQAKFAIAAADEWDRNDEATDTAV